MKMSGFSCIAHKFNSHGHFYLNLLKASSKKIMYQEVWHQIVSNCNSIGCNNPLLTCLHLHTHFLFLLFNPDEEWVL